MKKIALCGTPAFVIAFFEYIRVHGEYEIACVITQSAKKKGRNYQITHADVAVWAMQHSLPCFEIEKIRNEDHAHLESMLSSLECVLLFAFGKIIPQKWLDLPKFGWLNIHPSKLPAFRGPTPLQASVMETISGDYTSAITLMQMNARMDEGDIIAQREFIVTQFHTTNSLINDLCAWGPRWVYQQMHDYLNGKLQALPQSGDASYCEMIDNNSYNVAHCSSEEILAKIRAFGFVVLKYNGDPLKCFAATVPDADSLLVLQGVAPVFVQRPGKRLMHVRAFMNGVRR